MGRTVPWVLALLALVLTLGVGSAGGRSLVTTTITVQVIGKGRITSDPSGIKCGNGKTTCHLAFTGTGDITLFREAADGWSTNSWICPHDNVVDGNCVVDPPATGSAEFEVTATFNGPPTTASTLSVSHNDFAAGGQGVVGGGPGAPSGIGKIDCGKLGTTDHTQCTWTVVTGSTLTVLETPDTSATNPSVFDGWAGACSGTSVDCTVEMDGDQQVSAAWLKSSATALLTVAISGDGHVKGGPIDCPSACSATEPLNTTVTLAASPGDGSTFTGWTGDVCAATTATTCTFTMSGGTDVTATFTSPGPTLTVTVNGNGNVSGGIGAINCGSGATICSASFALNSTITLVATPATGATFTGWTGACGGSATTCTVAMSTSRDVTATFIGGTPTGGTTTVPLSVSVSGNGTVTGGGIRCGSGGAACSANQTLNAVVTLTATPDTGATFSGWGGACTGTATCSVTMTAAKTVTATFTGGAPPSVQLTVTVTGHGTVQGGGISCGNGLTACSTSLTPGTAVTLTEAPARGASFSGWGGTCSGFAKRTTCTVTVSTLTSVSATFTGGAPPPTGGAGLAALARPLVKHSKRGFLVTLRVRTPQAGTARVRGLRAGRLATSLSLRVPAGAATIGPFPVAKAGLYTFEIRLGSHALHWRTCLGRCGAAATAPRFVLTRETPVVTRAGAVWSVTLRFRASAISDDHIRVSRGGKLLSDHHFLAGTREIVVGPFLLGPGSYTLKLRAVDAYGRVKTLTWIVDLAR